MAWTDDEGYYTIWPNPVVNGSFEVPKEDYVKDPKFPHQCPRCSEDCYIGITTEHRRPEQDKKCQ